MPDDITRPEGEQPADTPDIAPLPGDPGATAAPGPAPAARGAAPAVGAEVWEAIGPASEAALRGFAQHAAEVLSVGLESVVAVRPEVQRFVAVLAEHAQIAAEFATRDHIGLDLRISLSEAETYVGAALIPLEDVGALLTIDMSPEQMADANFARGQLSTVAQGMRELLDLISLTLFSESLVGAEATLGEVRFGEVETTLGVLTELAEGVQPLRADFTLALPGGPSVGITLVVPLDLVTRIAELLTATATATTATTATTAAAANARPAALPFPAVGSAGGAPPLPLPLPPRPGTGASEGAKVTPLRPDMGGAGGRGEGADVPVHSVRFPPFSEPGPGGGVVHGIDLIMDVSMRITVELGRTSMTVEEILALGPGSVVELNKLAGEPVDILVNERLIARGEVVVVDENFGVRVTEIVSPRTRASAMGR